MTDDYPSIYHPDIGEYIEIKNELAFKTARVVWDDIAAKYEPVTIPVVVLEQKDPVQVKPALITDARDLSLAKSVIPSDELNPKGHTHDKRIIEGNHIGIRAHPWQDNEKDVLKVCATKEEAIKKYHENFPKSNRSDWSIEQRWFLLTKDKRGVIPGAKAKDGVILQKSAEKAEKRKGGSDYNPGKTVSCPYCDYTCNSHALHLHVMHKHPEKYQEHKNNPDRLNKGIHKEAIPQPQSETGAVSMTKEEAATLRDVSPKNNPDNGLSKPLQIVTGLRVKQIRPDNGRQFFGTGTVVARERDGAIIHVRNGGGKIHKIDATCLEVVTSPAEKKAEA